MVKRNLNYIGIVFVSLVALYVGLEWIWTDNTFDFFSGVGLGLFPVLIYGLVNYYKTNQSSDIIKILLHLQKHPWQSASEVHFATDVGFANVYVLLLRLEQEGVVESKWREGDVKPRTRLYAGR